MIVSGTNLFIFGFSVSGRFKKTGLEQKLSDEKKKKKKKPATTRSNNEQQQRGATSRNKNVVAPLRREKNLANDQI